MKRTGCMLLMMAIALHINSQVDVKHIALDLRFNWQKKQVYGRATLRLASLQQANTIQLDAGMLTIHSISKDNRSLKFELNDSVLTIHLDRNHKAGEDVKLVIEYNSNWVNATDPNNLWGSMGKGIRFFSPSSTEPRKRRQIWTATGPTSNRYWFPAHDALNDYRTTELTATVEKPLMVISNGRLIDSKDNGDGTRSFHWLMDTPYPNYLTSLVVGEYLDIKRNYEGVAIHSYCYPDEIQATRETTIRLTDMMRYYSEVTGVKYPFPSYSQVFVQEYPWGGGHNITASTITENMVDDLGTHADFLYLWDGVEAQDLASHWFGNYLYCGDWSDIWLNRGFSRYFDELYSEYKNGHAEFLIWNRSFDQTTYLSDWNNGIRHPIVTKNYDDLNTFYNDNYSFFRGASVLHMLRKHVGEENWWKIIKLYVAKNGNKAVRTEDFRNAVEEIIHEPMSWFFDQWLYKMGHPVFEVSKKYDDGKKQLMLTIRQTQESFFKGKMEIEIDDTIQTVWIDAKAENIFTFPALREPRLVNVDFESTWIAEMKFERSFEELLYQAQNDKDVLARIAAMKKLSAATDKVQAADALRNVIKSDLYWRVKVSALAQLGIIQPVPDETTTQLLLEVIRNSSSWTRSSAISQLGNTKDPKYADLYISYFTYGSDRVVNAAAVALGKSKSEKAFDALVKLKDKPSWKNQSLISALNGLKELGDERCINLALDALKDDTAGKRWTLAVSTWDYRIAAAETLVALGKGSLGLPVVLERLKKSVAENDLNDIHSNILLITTLTNQ